jgi:hypothetical protein
MPESPESKSVMEDQSQRCGEALRRPLLETEQYEDYEPDVWECEWCDGDGMDPMSDYCLECPHCGGAGRIG